MLPRLPETDVDLNELLSHHQVALIDMIHGASTAERSWAEQRADYYATRIVSLRNRLGADNACGQHHLLQAIMRG